MAGPVKGDVVVAPFPFTDLAQAKRRPALVVAGLTGEDQILCQITSKKRRDGYSIPLTKRDFTEDGLPLDSFIRPNRLFTAHRSLTIYRAGHVKPAKMEEVTQRLVEILRA